MRENLLHFSHLLCNLNHVYIATCKGTPPAKNIAVTAFGKGLETDKANVKETTPELHTFVQNGHTEVNFSTKRSTVHCTALSQQLKDLLLELRSSSI